MRPMRTLLAALASAFVATAAAAYPDKPVNFIIPFNAGGESDVAARFQQPFFKDMTGHDLIIQYQPGAGGAQAWAAMNGLPGDGYTWVGINLPHIIMQPMLQNPGYTTEDVAAIYFTHFTPHALIVKADSPYKTLQEVIDAAKANPGAITVSGTGTNSANHVANQEFTNLTGAQLTYIPYSGTAPSTTALLGGEVETQWGYTTVAAGQGDAVRMLAVAMEQRHPNFPDVPTFRELGFEMVGGAYRGVAVPKSTPEDVRKAASDLLERINRDPAHIKMMEDGGFAMTYVGYGDMAGWMAKQAAYYGEIAKQLGASK